MLLNAAAADDDDDDYTGLLDLHVFSGCFFFLLLVARLLWLLGFFLLDLIKSIFILFFKKEINERLVLFSKVLPPS